MKERRMFRMLVLLIIFLLGIFVVSVNCFAEMSNASLNAEYIAVGQGTDEDGFQARVLLSFNGNGGGTFQHLEREVGAELASGPFTYNMSEDGTFTLIVDSDTFNGIINSDGNIGSLSLIKDDYSEIYAFIKKSTAMTNAILKGEYIAVSQNTDGTGQRVLVTFDGNGNGNFQYLESNWEINSGSFTYSVSDNGTFTFSADGNTYNGIVNSDGNVCAIAFFYEEDSEIAVFVKKSTGMSNDDLKGEYIAIGQETEGEEARTLITFDGDGNATFQDIESNEDETDNKPLPFTYTVSADGTFTFNSEGETYNGIISSDANIGTMFFFSDISDPVAFNIFIKKSVDEEEVQFSDTYKASIYSSAEYFSEGTPENYNMVAAAIISDPGYKVRLKNSPTSAGDILLNYISSWSKFFPYLFVSSFPLGGKYPATGEDYEGIEYTFYIDKNDNGKLDSGESTDSFRLSAGSIKKLGSVQNVNISQESRPTITWNGIHSTATLYYRVMLFLANNDGNVDKANPLFISSFITPESANTFSYTYTGDLFASNETLYIAIDAVESIDSRYVNRSRYYQKHAINSGITGDNDGDGYTVDKGDCNDNDNTIYPGAIEILDDGIDQDCDGYDATFTDSLPAPSGLAANAVSSRKIMLRWTDNSPSKNSSFKIERKKKYCTDDTYQWEQIATVQSNEKAKNYEDVDDFEPGMKYSYRVRAYSGLDNSEYSNCGAILYPIPSVSGTPSAPVNLVATYSSASSVVLTWDEWSSKVTKFEIYRDVNDSGSWTLLGTTASDVLTYTDNTATNNQTIFYSYKVQACNDAGCSPPAYKVGMPAKPTGLSASVNAQDKIALSWTDNSDYERGFEIYRKTGSCSSSGSWEKIKQAGISRETVTDGSAASGMTYSYKIRVYYRSWGIPYVYGYSNWSDCVTITAP